MLDFNKLASCPDCGGTVSSRAAVCPHCGAPATAGLKEQVRTRKGRIYTSLGTWSVVFGTIGMVAGSYSLLWGIAGGFLFIFGLIIFIIGRFFQ